MGSKLTYLCLIICEKTPGFDLGSRVCQKGTGHILTVLVSHGGITFGTSFYVLNTGRLFLGIPFLGILFSRGALFLGASSDGIRSSRAAGAPVVNGGDEHANDCERPA